MRKPVHNRDTPVAADYPKGLPTRQRRRLSGAETRETLMNAAEELFATFGVEGVSIRSINAAAGLAPPAVHYHFSSKDRLLEAVLRRRGDAMIRRMHETLDAIQAADTDPTPRALFMAIAIPYREVLDQDPVGGLRWVRLVARLTLTNDRRLYGPLDAGGVHERFFRSLRRAFPGIDDERLQTAWLLATSTLIQMLGNAMTRAAHRRQTEGSPLAHDYIGLLVEFVASGFTAVLAAGNLPPSRIAVPSAVTDGVVRPSSQQRHAAKPPPTGPPKRRRSLPTSGVLKGGES